MPTRDKGEGRNLNMPAPLVDFSSGPSWEEKEIKKIKKKNKALKKRLKLLEDLVMKHQKDIINLLGLNNAL